MPPLIGWALAVVAVAEAIGLAVLAVQLKRDRRELNELRHRVDAREQFFSGSREAVKTVWQTANLVRKRGFTAALHSSIQDLADWAEVERPDLARLAPDGHVTLMFSDIEQSTAHNERIGDRAWVKLLEKHDKLIRQRVKDFGGHVIKSQGDGFMIAFAEPTEAVGCAMDVQNSLLRGAKHKGTNAIRVRIGIHTGKSVRRGDDLFGRNVAMAARVAAEADGGEILVSQTVYDTVDVKFGEPREVALKGFAGTHSLYPVTVG